MAIDDKPSTTQSETIGKLAAAMAAAQKTIKPPKKTRTGKVKGVGKGGNEYEYSYSYADLADVIESYREPLSANGLTLLQPIRERERHMVLVTVLVHESGEWIGSEYPLANYSKPQETGSALTYARRYSASSMLGIAAEDDDDGERAQAATPEKRAAQAPPKPGKPEVLTESEVNALKPYAKAAGFETSDAMAELVTTISGAKFLRTMERRWLPDLQSALEGIAAARGEAKAQ